MIDTHAHLYAEEFAKDRDHVLAAAAEAGVEKILMPNVDDDSMEPMLALEKAHPKKCYAMMGLHPCYVKADFRAQLAVVKQWVVKRDFIAIGEIGTDLYWDKSYWEQQVEAFHFQCELALQHSLPIVIHCRESMEETLSMVEEYAGKGLKGVFHCFTGTVAQAERITNQGFYLGLGGVSTFKNSGMDKIIPHLDREKIMLETDAPYLAPVPVRGKRNEPGFLAHICHKIAEFLDLSTIEVNQLTTANAHRLFFPNVTADEL